ncbi:MAG: hypothetical protein AAFQ79_03545 [Pseudomonadota bacterium]
MTFRISERQAHDVANDFLFATGRSLLEGKYDQFRSYFRLPLFLETQNGLRIVTTEHALRQTYDGVRDHHRAQGVTDQVRSLLSVQVLGHNSFSFTHVTGLIGPNGKVVQHPFPAQSVVTRSSGVWAISGCFYAILRDRKLSDVLASDLPPDVRQDRDGATPGGTHPSTPRG